MLKRTNSAARLIMPVAAMAFVFGLAACGNDAPPTVTKTVTSRTTTGPAYVTPAPGTTTPGSTTTTTQSTTSSGTSY